MKKLLISIVGIGASLGIYFVKANTYPTELAEAYNWAYQNGIISESSIEDAKLYDVLTNSSLKTILLNYTDYLGLDANSATILFGDLFNAGDSETNRAIFGTALSRILWGDKYNGGNPYYIKHLEALQSAGIINQIDNPEDKNEIKGYVLSILKNSIKEYEPRNEEPAVSYPAELVEAYNWAYQNGIISESSIEDAKLYDVLTNSSLKTILLNYTEYLGINQYSATTFFGDLFNAGNSETNRAIFGTALSRILWGDKYNGGNPYYIKHLEALKSAGIMNQIDNPESRNEIKGYVLSMLKNSSDKNLKCEGMGKANIIHTIDNDTITLKWNAIEGDNVKISIYNPNSEKYENIGTVKMSDKKFSYKIKWDGKQNFKLSNECDELKYIADVNTTTQCEGMEKANIIHTIDNDTITLKWNAIEGDNVKISIYNPNSEKYENIGTVKMSDKKFTYKVKWDGEQNFKLSNGCKDFYYKLDMHLDNKDSVELAGNLVNNIKKTIEFKSNEVGRKVVFSGTYTALKDTTINYYGIDTKYDESKGNDYIDKRCEKNKTDMRFYVYIDGKIVDNTLFPKTCYLGQGAGFGKRIDEITLKKGQSKNIKVEIEMSGSVQEDDLYNFIFSLNYFDKISTTEKGKAMTNIAPIKILKNDNKAVNLDTNKENNQNNTETTTNKTTSYNKGNSSEILNNGYTREMNNAYQFAYKNGITTTKNIEKSKMNSPLTRIAMAKMLSNYAINVLGKTPDISKGSPEYNDVTKEQNKKYDNAVTLAYQLGIMGQNIKSNNFRPNDEVTRAEFVTALSRMLYGTSDGKGNTKYYEPHMSKLYKEGIISKNKPKIIEKRGYVMLMLMRAAE